MNIFSKHVCSYLKLDNLGVLERHGQWAMGKSVHVLGSDERDLNPENSTTGMARVVISVLFD